MKTTTRLRAGRRLRARLRGDGTGVDGFTIIEVIVALGVLVTGVLASTGFFISALRATGGSDNRQAATQVAQQMMDFVGAADPTKLLVGRKQTDVTNLESALGLPNTSVRSNYDLDPNTNGTTHTSPPTIPLCTDTEPSRPSVSGWDCPTSTTSPVASNGVTYTVRTAIDVCARQTTGTNPTCLTSGGGTSNLMYLVIVDVSWPKRGAVTCSTLSGATVATCHLSERTLIDANQYNPLFVDPNPIVNQVTPQGPISPDTTFSAASPMLTLNGANLGTTGTATVTTSLTGATVSNPSVLSDTGSVATVGGVTTCASASGTGTIAVSGASKTSSFPISIGPTITANWSMGATASASSNVTTTLTGHFCTSKGTDQVGVCWTTCTSPSTWTNATSQSTSSITVKVPTPAAVVTGCNGLTGWLFGQSCPNLWPLSWPTYGSYTYYPVVYVKTTTGSITTPSYQMPGVTVT